MSPRPSAHARLLAATVVALLATACSSSDDSSTTTSAPSSTAEATTSPAPPSADAGTPSPTPAAVAAPAQAPTITIADFDYAVPPSVPPGTPVQATNRDREAHTVTIRGGGPAVVVPGGSTVTLTAPAQPGSYEIVCDFHGDMTAPLVVG